MAQITVYGAPWCPDCRRSKQFLSENRIDYDWVDIDEQPEAQEVVRRLNEGKQIIPTIVFDDGSSLAEPSNSELATKLGLNLRAKRSFYDLIIVGGGPAGLTAAIYGAREGIQSLVIDRSALGGQAGVTERIDNYPGFPEGIPGAELARRLIDHAHRYEVEMLSGVNVSRLTSNDHLLSVETEQRDEYAAHAAIIATGSSYRRMNVPGESELIGAGIHFCATCDGPFYKGAAELMVIGGGNSGVEEGLFLTQFADKIRLIEFNPELKASTLLQEKIRSDPKFEIHTNHRVSEFRRAKDGKFASVLVEDRDSKQVTEFHPAAAFVFIGLDPNTAFLRETMKLDPWGFILTDDIFQTSIPGAYAAGDVRAGSTKQLASATGEGVTALLMVRNRLQKLGDIAVHEEAYSGAPGS